MLRVLCLVCVAIGAILAIQVSHNDSLDCVEQMCLSGMSLMGGMGVGMLLIWLFSDSCGCLGISLSDWFDNLTSSLDVRQCARHTSNFTNQSYESFRQSYYDSKSSHERARQQKERSIKELIRQIEEIAK